MIILFKNELMFGSQDNYLSIFTYRDTNLPLKIYLHLNQFIFEM